MVDSATSKPQPNPAYQQWFQKDQLALSWILSSLLEEVFTYIVGLKSAFQVWQALEKAFGSFFDTRKLQQLTLDDKNVS